MPLKNSYLISLLILISACGAPKQVSEYEMLPDWAKSRPLVADAYVGIGHAKKLGTSTNYIKKARENALADLSSEISVVVNSASVLHTLNTEQGTTETLYTRNKLTSTDYFDGFEPVAYFDGATEYWVYYKIDKQLYLQKKKERKQMAAQSSLKLLKTGITQSENHQVTEAFSNKLKALEKLKDYYGEEVNVDYDGTEVDLGKVILSSLKESINDLEVIAPQSSYQFTRGEKPKRTISFKIRKNHSGLENIPVNYQYSGGYLLKSSGISNMQGICQASLPKIKSLKESETLGCEVDLFSMARNAVKDTYLRNYFKHYKAPKAEVQILIQSPSLKIANKDLPQLQNGILTSVDQLQSKYGFELSTNKSSQLTLLIQNEIQSNSQQNGIARYTSNIGLKLLSQNGKTLAEHHELISEIGASAQEAEKKAEAKIFDRLNTIALPIIFDQYFKK